MRKVYADQILPYLNGQRKEDFFFWTSLVGDTLNYLDYKTTKDAKYSEYLAKLDTEEMEPEQLRRHNAQVYARSLEEENIRALRRAVELMGQEIDRRNRQLRELLPELQQLSTELRHERAERRFYQQSFLDELNNSQFYSRMLDRFLPPDDVDKTDEHIKANIQMWRPIIEQTSTTKAFFDRTQKSTTHDRSNRPTARRA